MRWYRRALIFFVGHPGCHSSDAPQHSTFIRNLRRRRFRKRTHPEVPFWQSLGTGKYAERCLYGEPE